MKPLLSIVIPTKNRQEYCRKTINHITSIQTQDIQLVIQDNSDEDILREFCNQKKDYRIDYFYSAQRMNISENFELAVKNIIGEYFIFLGDDDSIHPNIIEIVKFFKSKGAESIVPRFPMYYVYPNPERGENGNLNYLKPSSKYSIVKTQKELTNLVKKGLLDYNHTSLPRPYHGIIKTSVLKKIKDKNMKLFNGVSPDIYSCIILSNFITESYHVDFPFSIAGACPQSGSSMGTNKTHCGRLEDAMHFKGREIIWTERLPRYYSVETIWAFAGIQALIDTKSYDRLKLFNVNRMVARSLLMNTSIFNIILTEYKVFSKNNITMKINLMVFFMVDFLSIFYTKALRKWEIYILKRRKIYTGVESFADAINLFNANSHTFNYN
ncbi:glycosyltransferase family 2 protein [Gaoshiqia sp. Z1-71]|uniref:glycosyltransferase family 2 protein n=1 Tax=Gaoshiqia hydrogeniformans TaxID=3290090 RepID=UPI003BF891F8